MEVDFNRETITCKCGHVEPFCGVCMELCPCCNALFYECPDCELCEELPGDKQQYFDHEDLCVSKFRNYQSKPVKRGFKFFLPYKVRSSCVV